MNLEAAKQPPTARFALNLLQDSAQRLLLLKRSPKTRLGPGQWGLPAGKIEPGETPEQAAIRECNEEIGPDHQLVLQRYLGPIRDSFYGGQYEIHLFHYHWDGGVIVLNDEHTESAWVEPQAYKNYDVMDGIDEDIALLSLWPREFLREDKIPAYLSQRDEPHGC